MARLNLVKLAHYNKPSRKDNSLSGLVFALGKTKKVEKKQNANNGNDDSYNYGWNNERRKTFPA